MTASEPETEKPLGADYPTSRQPVLRELPPVATRAVVATSGIPISTVNVWINRGLFPWVQSGTPGRARHFSIDFAMHLAITGFLVRLGCGAAQASGAALDIMQEDLGRPGLKAIIGPSGGPTGMFTSPAPRLVRVIQADVLTDADLAGGCIALDIGWLVGRLIEAAKAAEKK
jgi:hypothetical protein